MGHAVLHCEKIDDILPFYRDVLGFHLSDYFTKPFAAYFFHVNPRHHSVAFIEFGKAGIHHLMVETCFLDDVGQCYDIAQKKPEMIATTFGRHYNDQVHSFHSWSPSKFMFEYGWGGRTIDTENWTPEVITQGPSLWATNATGSTRSSATRRATSHRECREAGYRLQLNVMEGNYKQARDVCPWWDATAPLADRLRRAEQLQAARKLRKKKKKKKKKKKNKSTMRTSTSSRPARFRTPAADGMAGRRADAASVLDLSVAGIYAAEQHRIFEGPVGIFSASRPR